MDCGYTICKRFVTKESNNDAVVITHNAVLTSLFGEYFQPALYDTFQKHAVSQTISMSVMKMIKTIGIIILLFACTAQFDSVFSASSTKVLLLLLPNTARTTITYTVSNRPKKI